jgi:hypothetical protein
MADQSAVKSEAMLFWRYITSSIDQLFGTMKGLSAAEINCSPVGNANSLYVLATHTMGTTAENLLEVLCGQLVHRQRDAEFAAQGHSPDALSEQWQQLRAQIQTHMEQIDNASLNEPRHHPRRGEISGRDVLIVVARHSAEHMGQAFLTRDLILAQRKVSATED